MGVIDIMKKITLAAICISAVFALAGCNTTTLPAPKVPETRSKDMTVGEDITEDDIREFYYTVENINLDAYYLRYKFYVDDGRHMFLFEERQRPDDYGPATEEDTTAKATFEMSDDEWSRFCKIISGGTVKEREDDPGDGDTGPWTYLYWEGDKDRYQQYSFRSQSRRKDFEELCSELAEKGSPDKKKENDQSRSNDKAKDAFEEFIKDNFTQVSSMKANVVTKRNDEGIYSTEYPADLFGLIDYHIADIDGDGLDELLIFQLSGEDVYENLWVMACEYNEKVELTGTYEYGENILEPDDGDTFAFLYDLDGRPVIGIMTEDSYYTRADGMDIIFTALTYDGNDFTVLGTDEYQGSDMEDIGFTDVMKKCGVPARWDAITGWEMEDVHNEVLSSCDGRMLAEVIIKTDDVKEGGEEDGYMPVEIKRHVQLKGYSNDPNAVYTGSKKKGKKK